MRRIFIITLLALVPALSPGVAHAHVTITPKAVQAGPAKLTFRVPHGCEGSPTLEVRLVIPEGIIGVKPAPKPGWTVSTLRGAYARTYDYFHGRKLSEGVKEVVWKDGRLPDDHFDEFEIIGFASDAFTAGEQAYFKVHQSCEAGKLDWVDIPQQGDTKSHLKAPAPALKIEGGHHHHHH